jgi:hypothetical protein
VLAPLRFNTTHSVPLSATPLPEESGSEELITVEVAAPVPTTDAIVNGAVETPPLIDTYLPLRYAVVEKIPWVREVGDEVTAVQALVATLVIFVVVISGGAFL